MKLSSLCQYGSFLRAFLFFKNVLNIIFVVVPIILIISIIMKLGKIVISGKTDELKEAFSTSVKKLIAGLAIFLMPTILSYTFDLVGESFDELQMCMDNATTENIKYYDSISAAISALDNMEQNPTKANVSKAQSAVNKIASIAREDDMISFIKRISDAQIKAEENDLIMACKAKNGRYENGMCLTIQLEKPQKNDNSNSATSGSQGGSSSSGNYSYDPVLNSGGSTELNTLGGTFTVANTKIKVLDYVNFVNKRGIYQASNISKYTDKCLGFAYVHACGQYTGNTSSTPDDGANYRAGNCSFSTYVNDSKEDVLSKVFNEIVNGRPVVIQVNGNKKGTSRHFVTVVGFNSRVNNAASLTEKDLLIIDSYDGKLERMDTEGARFMTSGKDCGKKDYSGYRIQYIKS